jgi:hypothetical protein
MLGVRRGNQSGAVALGSGIAVIKRNEVDLPHVATTIFVVLK